ncbi:MAG TPA: hypothetical protein VJ867_11815 [Gemmatimonadaceae bacterium]|nr:hypothetical protein [Gemmatimonadaceae bacterium]
MSDYRIEKIRRHVSVVLTDGSRLEGDVFLRPISRYRSRPEEPLDLFNDGEPFFALQQNGAATLIAKVNVSHATLPVPEEDDSNLAAVGVPVQVTLVDGTVCGGSIFLETRADRPRLLDFLNAYSSRFLPVVDVQQVLLVNKDVIAHVREVS